MLMRAKEASKDKTKLTEKLFESRRKIWCRMISFVQDI